MASGGGQGAAEAELRGFLSILDDEPEVSYNLGLTSSGDGGTFLLTIEG